MKKLPLLFLYAMLISTSSSLLVSCTNEIDRALNSIDRAIIDINATSVGWQSIVTNLGKDIPHEAHDVIGNDLEILAKDVIGATTEGTFCTVDFVKGRTVQTLKALKYKLLKRQYKISIPGFCSPNISSIDLNSDPISRSTLVLYGYDLKSRDTVGQPLQIALVGQEDKKLVSEEFIGRGFNYQLSINLNALTPELSKNRYDKIQLYWNGDSTDMPQILIQHWKPKIVEDFISPKPITFIPQHIGGDTDFDTEGDNPTIGKVFVEYNITKTFIDARVYMDAMEEGGDNTRVGGPADQAYSPWTRIYTVSKPDFEILEFSPNTKSEWPIRVNDKGPKEFFQAGGSVSSYILFIDDKGPEAGTKTRVDVLWNKLTILLIQKVSI